MPRFVIIIATMSISSIGLLGCSNGPSHMPAPWQIPGAVGGTVIENGLYGHRRAKVIKYLRQNWTQVQIDIQNGGGEVINHTFDIAKVSYDKRAAVLKETKARPDIYQAGSLEVQIETLTVTLMVHSR